MSSKQLLLLKRVLIWLIVIGLLFVCADIVMRFTLLDPTFLGDPYYRTDILADQRAPVALLFCWITVLLGLILGIIRLRK